MKSRVTSGRLVSYCLYLLLLLACSIEHGAKEIPSEVSQYYWFDSVRVTIDTGVNSPRTLSQESRLVLYSLPNGNSTEWTMGKRKLNVDDWHVDIQHIFAQTNWLRKNNDHDWSVAYLEAPDLSWPHWIKTNSQPGTTAHEIVNRARSMVTRGSDNVTISSHSGGGAFINSLIESSESIPGYIKKINYIDSNYGYNSEIGLKLIEWLQRDLQNSLVVLAYNDSVALYRGRAIVGAQGGTWFKTKEMLSDLSSIFTFDSTITDSLNWYENKTDQILIVLKKNPDRGIYHTEQVELNGFIMSMLYGDAENDMRSWYFGSRIYQHLIERDFPVFVDG